MLIVKHPSVTIDQTIINSHLTNNKDPFTNKYPKNYEHVLLVVMVNVRTYT